MRWLSMNGSSVAKLLLAVVVALAGLCLTIGFIGIKTGHITIIFGDDNKVDNRDQSQTVVEPTKRAVTPAPQAVEPANTQAAQPIPQTVAVSEVQAPAVLETHHATYIPQRRYYQSDDESEDDCVCTCPDDEEAGDEGEEEDDGGGVTLQTAA
jgi:hypothetical protein